MVQTVKQAVQNHVTPVLPSHFGWNAFTTYSPFSWCLKLSARSSGPSAAGFSACLSSSRKLVWGCGAVSTVSAAAPLAPQPAPWIGAALVPASLVRAWAALKGLSLYANTMFRGTNGVFKPTLSSLEGFSTWGFSILESPGNEGINHFLEDGLRAESNDGWVNGGWGLGAYLGCSVVLSFRLCSGLQILISQLQ